MQFAPRTNTCAAMSSPSRFKVPVRNLGHRGFRDPPPSTADAAADAAQEGVSAPPSVSGDFHLKAVQDANYDLRRRHRGGGAWHPRGAEGVAAPLSVSGDSHFKAVQDANNDLRRPHSGGGGGGAWHPRGAPHQSFARWRSPSNGPPPPQHGHPASYYGPPPPSYGLPPPFYGHPPLQSYGPVFSPHGHPLPFHDPPPTPFLPSRPSFHPPHSTFRPQAFRPSPPPRPADYRTWSFCPSQPPPQCERFVVLSYNILADYLARDHRPKLYFHIPHYILDWEWRKRRLLLEFRLWAPDIMCLQEVDRFHDLEAELATQGYAGIWKMRTGNAIDGCAIFWRTNRFQLKYDETIEFNKLGLRDNVAQICVLESRIQGLVENESASLPESSDQSRRANLIVVCNIHVLYNPKRGEIKLGQVRTLLHRAHAVSKIWNDAPVVVCGDFNSTPKSPLYNFIAEQKLTVSGLARDQVSGQYSACISSSRLYTGSALSRTQPYVSEGTVGSCKRQHKTENKCKTEEAPLPERGNDLLDVPPLCSDRPSLGPDVAKIRIGEGESFNSESCSAHCRNVQISTDICSSHSQLSRSEGAASTISSIDHSSSRVPSDVSRSMTEYSESKQNVSDGNYESSFQYKEPSELVADSSAQAEKRMTETPAGTAFNEVLIDNQVEKENHGYSGDPSSEISLRRSSGDRGKEIFQGAENVLDNDVAVESSCDMVSGAIPAVSEVYSENIRCFLTDMTVEKEMTDPVMIHQITCESKLLDTSASGDSSMDLKPIEQSLDEASNTREYDSTTTTCLKSSYNHNEPKQSISDVASLSADFDSTVNLFNDHSDNNSVGEVDNKCEYISGSEENSDPDFFRELVGTGDVYQFSDDSVTARKSGQNRSSVSSYSSGLDPSSAENWEESVVLGASSLADNTEKHSYNPYLWTPLEIEVASGNAECTFLEHSLKLRSVYTDVEDYAGTKDYSKEPEVTSYNRQFMGTVDYIWSSEGLHTSKVLDTFPKHVLQQTSGFPTKRWGSDHVALACELAFTNGSSTE